MSILMNFERQFFSNQSKSFISIFRNWQCEVSARIYAPDIVLMSIHAEHEQGTVFVLYQYFSEEQNCGLKDSTPFSILSVNIGIVGDIRKLSLSFAIARFQFFQGFN